MLRHSTRTVLPEADSLYQALDDRIVERRGRRWRLNVCGIVSDPSHRWIQVRLAGLTECLLTIRLDVAADAADYYDAVTTWVDQAFASDGV